MTLALYHNDMSSCAQKVRLMLAEKGLQWESRHLNLRAGEHQQAWYVKLNPRAVVPTLIDGDIVVPESNVINEYLDERFPDPPLKPADPFGRAKMRLWTKQLDEGVHDAGIAILSFGVAFRHQYISKGEAGKEMLESIPDPIKRERRRDVIEKGLDSAFFKIAISRLLTLATWMTRWRSTPGSPATPTASPMRRSRPTWSGWTISMCWECWSRRRVSPTGTGEFRPVRASRTASRAGTMPTISG
jgi:glutathione S-transferase